MPDIFQTQKNLNLIVVPAAVPPHIKVTDDQILSALFGETVTFSGPRFNYTLIFDGTNFVTTYELGVMTCDETNLRLLRCL